MSIIKKEEYKTSDMNRTKDRGVYLNSVIDRTQRRGVIFGLEYIEKYAHGIILEKLKGGDYRAISVDEIMSDYGGYMYSVLVSEMYNTHIELFNDTCDMDGRVFDLLESYDIRFLIDSIQVYNNYNSKMKKSDEDVIDTGDFKELAESLLMDDVILYGKNIIERELIDLRMRNRI